MLCINKMVQCIIVSCYQIRYIQYVIDSDVFLSTSDLITCFNYKYNFGLTINESFFMT